MTYGATSARVACSSQVLDKDGVCGSPAGDLEGNGRTKGMPTGKVKWFNATKGYGFIEPEDGGKDVFVHISAVERSGLQGLQDDQKVQFELTEGRDGRQLATDLVVM